MRAVLLRQLVLVCPALHWLLLLGLCAGIGTERQAHAQQAGAERAPTRLRVAWSDRRVPVGQRVVLSLRASSTDGAAVTLWEGTLRFHPQSLRYLGQEVGDTSAALLINDREAGRGRLRLNHVALTRTPVGAAQLVFEVLDTMYTRFLAAEVGFVAAGGTERPAPSVVREGSVAEDRALRVPRPVRMSGADWLRAVERKYPAAEAALPNDPTRRPSGPWLPEASGTDVPSMSGGIYGDVNGDGSINSGDLVRIANYVVGNTVAPALSSPEGIRANVAPANSPGLGEAPGPNGNPPGDRTSPPGWTNCAAALTSADQLGIANASVGNPTPIAGQPIPPGAGPPSQCTGTTAPEVMLPGAETKPWERQGADPFAVTQVVSTVPYVSLDQPRALSLAYRSDRVLNRPFVHVDVRHPGTSAPPTWWYLEARRNGVPLQFSTGETRLRFAASTAWLRLGGQINADISGIGLTGVYPVDLVVTADYGASLAATSIATKVVVLNERASPIARGWTLVGEQRIYPQPDGSLLVSDGLGGVSVFEPPPGGPGGGLPYISPAGDPSTIFNPVNNDTEGFKRVWPDSTRLVFDEQGYLRTASDRFGNQSPNLTRFGRDHVTGAVTYLEDGLGKRLTLQYGSGRLTSITDPGGRVTTVTVDTNSTSRLLTAWRLPDGLATTFGYDAQQRLNTVTDRLGATTTFGYSGLGQLATVTAPAVAIHGEGVASPVSQMVSWQSMGVPTSITSGSLLGPRVPVDSAFASVTEPGGATARFLVNAWGAPTVSVDPRGAVSTTTYDVVGRPVTSTAAHYGSGQADSVRYVPGGPGLVAWSRPAGADSTVITYDPAKFWAVTSVTGPGQPVQTIGLTPLGLPQTVTTGGQTTVTYSYDSRGRLTTTTDGKGVVVETRSYAWHATENTLENLRSVTRPGGHVTTLTYDTLGRRVRTVSADAPSDSVAYDVLNRVVHSRTMRGASISAMSYAYNALHQTSLTDPLGLVHQTGYNALGWVTTQTDPAGRVQSYTYSRDGDLRSWTNRRNQTLTYTYDLLHRRIGKSGTNTSPESWVYPASATERWVVSVSTAARDSVTTDIRGRPTHTTTTLAGQAYAQAWTYSLDGRLLTHQPVAPGGGLTLRTYSWNAERGLLTGIRLGGAPTDSVRYDANFQPTSFGGNSRQYGDRHAAYALVNASGGEVAWRGVAFDTVGRVRDQLRSSGTSVGVEPYQLDRRRRYTYDALGRLGSALEQALDAGTTCDADPVNGYTCVGLPGTRWRPSGTATTYSYNAGHHRTDLGATYGSGGDADRLGQFGACSYTHDADGHVTSRAGAGCVAATFSWSAEGRLQEVTAGGVTTAYAYDAAGRLVHQMVQGSSDRYFLWQQDHLLAELSGTATAVLSESSYWPGADRLHALRTPATGWAEAMQDALGNVILLGSPARVYGYSDWGEQTLDVGASAYQGLDRSRWKGALRFAPGGAEMYFMRNRWYEPRTGRFLSQDPIGFAGGPNLYAFAAGDPVNYADPDGLKNCLVSNDCRPYQLNEIVSYGRGWRAAGMGDFLGLMLAANQGGFGDRGFYLTGGDPLWSGPVGDAWRGGAYAIGVASKALKVAGSAVLNCAPEIGLAGLSVVTTGLGVRGAVRLAAATGKVGWAFRATAVTTLFKSSASGAAAGMSLLQDGASKGVNASLPLWMAGGALDSQRGNLSATGLAFDFAVAFTPLGVFFDLGKAGACLAR